MLNKNELYEVQIEDTNDLGYGVCRIDGQVVFVALAVTGDSARIRIIKVLKNYAVARIDELLTPSEYRTACSCDSFTRCGGCSFLHIKREKQTQLKESFVRAAVKKAGLSLPVRPLLSGKQSLRYRNKAQYPLYKDASGHIRVGFYARRTHTCVPADGCLLQPEIFSEIANAFCAEFDKANLSCYDETSGKGLLRHFNLRIDTDGHVVAEIVLNAKHGDLVRGPAEAVFDAFDALKGVSANANTKNTNVIRGEKSEVLCGEMTLCQTLGDKHFFHGPASFFQVNAEAATILFREARRLLSAPDNEQICDLYCGVGAVGQCVAPNSHIHGADVVKEAISFARKNAQQNGCDATYVAMDAAEYFASAGSFDTVLVDPPRSGLSSEMTDLLLHKKPKKILYISCNPATLCRDLALLLTAYTTDGITPVDLFPQTGHVESVCLLTRK